MGRNIFLIIVIFFFFLKDDKTMNLDQEPEPDCAVVLNQDTASVASDPD